MIGDFGAIGSILELLGLDILELLWFVEGLSRLELDVLGRGCFCNSPLPSLLKFLWCLFFEEGIFEPDGKTEMFRRL